MNRRGEKRIGAAREKLSSFIKITREMNQWHWWANNRYTYLGNRWKRLHNYIIWKIELSQPWTFDDDSDCMQFLTSTDVRGRKYWSMFGFPWKNPSDNSQWYIKKWVLWYGLEPTSWFRLVTSSTLQSLFRVFQIRFSFVCVLWHANQLRNGIYCACTSAGCVPLWGELREKRD